MSHRVYEREVFSPFDGSEDVAALSPKIEQSFVGEKQVVSFTFNEKICGMIDDL